MVFLILPGEFGKHLEIGNDIFLWNNFLLTENSRSDIQGVTGGMDQTSGECSLC